MSSAMSGIQEFQRKANDLTKNVSKKNENLIKQLFHLLDTRWL